MSAAAKMGAERAAVETFCDRTDTLHFLSPISRITRLTTHPSTLPGIPAISSQSFSVAPASLIILRVTVAATTSPSKKYFSPESMLPSSVILARETCLKRSKLSFCTSAPYCKISLAALQTFRSLHLHSGSNHNRLTLPCTKGLPPAP